MAHTNPLYCDIDLKAPGRQLGYLRLPYSVHRSAYGQIHMPIACLSTGAGPSVVVMAGNHGDEYEGQVAISRLINELPLEQIAGRLILLPMANFPAAAAGLRTSPLDGGNLNRLFGTPAQASPTWFIADYLERVLFQGIDFFFDLHSGGSSLRYLPSMLCADDFKGKQAEQATALVEAYALPYTLMHESDADGTFASSGARRLGAVAVTTELGGAGTIQPDVMALAYDGLKRALAVTGVYRGPVTPAKGKTQRLRLDDRHYAFAAEPGVFAPLHALGHQAQKGEEAGQIHFLETPGRTPLTVTYPSNGLLLCQRVPARVERGDCLFHLAEPLDA